MAKRKAPPEPQGQPDGITSITVCGFKSIAEERTIEVRPLTLLAGANSSGKSSIMQPVLLLKQTLEAPYDPGPLRLDGPNVTFTSAEQLLSRLPDGSAAEEFSVGVAVWGRSVMSVFGREADRGLVVEQTAYEGPIERTVLHPRMTDADIAAVISEQLEEIGYDLPEHPELALEWRVLRRRSFLEPVLTQASHTGRREYPTAAAYLCGLWQELVVPHIRQLVHLPGLRGIPERTYPVAAVGSTYPGTFDKYTASVIARWQAEGNTEKLATLGEHLAALGLTWTAEARAVNDTQVELRVGRLPRPSGAGDGDLVSVADVGFGVSQAVPVVVALLAAEPGQAVYLEQPELHLHPRAQVAMAGVLADAARRGVRVIAETHSSLLLLGVQSLVAEGELPAELVKLHWFLRREDGVTGINSADLDEAGAFGEWPEDFGEVALQAESRFLDATEARLRAA